MIRTLLIVIAALGAAPALAGTRDAPLGAGPFTLDGPAARGAILVVESGAACDADGAAAQAALAAAAGQAVGVVAEAGSACGAAAALAARPGASVAFANGRDAFGPAGTPNAWLAERRQRGVYVWDLAAWRDLHFTGRREVLGLFAPAADRPAPSVAEMVDAAVAALAAPGEGWFLLVQAEALDDDARAALGRAGRAGARVIAADGIERYSALAAN